MNPIHIYAPSSERDYKFLLVVVTRNISLDIRQWIHKLNQVYRQNQMRLQEDRLEKRDVSRLVSGTVGRMLKKHI
jgi:hypothetical protein